ncbi:hypothetical protein LWI29_020800 [Acer saccharum]|uniref:Uncharacterized protein n=1 Tax=Acer saccharum TaxID=4024 RepID=A0AA39SPA3_ACESA|nr:hypothetical protein LWI29_020800 [Acer saccharum]
MGDDILIKIDWRCLHHHIILFLHLKNKAKSNSSAKTPSDQGNKVGDIFPDASLEEYAAKSRGDKGNNDEDINNEDADNETGDGDHGDEVEDEDNVEDGDRVCN